MKHSLSTGTVWENRWKASKAGKLMGGDGYKQQLKKRPGTTQIELCHPHMNSDHFSKQERVR